MPLSAVRPARACAMLAMSALLTTALTGCGALTDGDATESRTVVASFYPLAWVAEEVAGAGWTVDNLTAAGGEPHDLELSIAATAAISEAALVIHLDGFQPAVDDTIATNADAAILDAGQVVDLRPLADHGAEGDPEESGHDHDPGAPDPHFWLDPVLMADLAAAVAEELAALDPDNADAYRDRAARLGEELDALDEAYASGLADCRRDVVVVSHDAFGYLAKYGLRLEPIAGLSPGAEPTPAVLGRLSDLIREEGLTTVFSERLASPALAETLASDLDVSLAVLDPLEGLTDQTTGEDYFSLMRSNLAALQKANGC